MIVFEEMDSLLPSVIDVLSIIEKSENSADSWKDQRELEKKVKEINSYFHEIEKTAKNTGGLNLSKENIEVLYRKNVQVLNEKRYRIGIE